MRERASIRALATDLSGYSFFLTFSAISDYSCRRPYPASLSRFPESITRRSCNIFVTGDIVATDTNKAQTDGRTDEWTDRDGAGIFRLLTTAENAALRRHELAKASNVGNNVRGLLCFARGYKKSRVFNSVANLLSNLERITVPENFLKIPVA